LRVLIISRFVSKPSWQGSAQHVSSLSKLLLKKNHNVKVVSGEYVDELVFTEQDYYKLVKFPIKYEKNIEQKFLNASKSSLSNYELAKKIIEDFKPDLIHIGVPLHMNAFIDLGYKFKIPMVAMMHSYEWVCMQRFLLDSKNLNCIGPSISTCSNCIKGYSSMKYRAFNLLFDNFLFKTFFNHLNLSNGIHLTEKVKNTLDIKFLMLSKINYFITQSDYSKKILIDSGVHSNKIFRVNQYLTDKKLKYFSNHKSNKKLVIGYVGRLSPEKGISILDNALKKLHSLKNSFEIHILSLGANKNILKKYMPKIIDEDFTIKLHNNLVGENDLQIAMANLDVCIIPSIVREVGPRVMLEVMAQKTPCITTDLVGNNYLIDDNVNGKILHEKYDDNLSKVLKIIIKDRSILSKWKQNIKSIKNENMWYKEVIDIFEKSIN
jgi:glycosyltransferase involved in cell wall biosynthesis